MSSGAPWSVKGIDPKAREIAKDLARRSGMTLGEWLNQIILEDGPAPALSSEPKSATPVEPTTPMALSAAFESSARVAAPPRHELDRLFEGLDQLAARVEAAEHRSTLAISGIDQSVLGVLSRMENAEREQVHERERDEDGDHAQPLGEGLRSINGAGHDRYNLGPAARRVAGRERACGRHVREV